MKTCQTPKVVLDSVVVESVLSLLNEHMTGCESRPSGLGSGAWCSPAGQQPAHRRKGQEREGLL